MRIIGLTGSIGMGKSTAALLLRRMGFPIHDADATVHRLLGRGGLAVPAVGAAFPGVVRDGVIDRRRLGDLVFGGADKGALHRLEAILHPLVRRATQRWLAAQARARARLVVLDVPLLYETWDRAIPHRRRYDSVIVVSAPAFLQKMRVLRRPGMTAGKLADILLRQLPDAQKRGHADLVAPSGLGIGPTWRALQRVRRLKNAGAWGPGYR